MLIRKFIAIPLLLASACEEKMELKDDRTEVQRNVSIKDGEYIALAERYILDNKPEKMPIFSLSCPRVYRDSDDNVVVRFSNCHVNNTSWEYDVVFDKKENPSKIEVSR